MHKSVYDFVAENVQDAKGKRVLEIGSYDENGSVRWRILDQKPDMYAGIDIRACDHENHYDKFIDRYNFSDIFTNKCVDFVIQASKLTDIFATKYFDIVICTEVLEHVEDWQSVVSVMRRLCSENGYLILTTRSPGFPYHPYPEDYWRFTVEDMKKIFSSRKKTIIVPDPEQSGVFVKAWNERNPFIIPENIHKMKIQRIEKP